MKEILRDCVVEVDGTDLSANVSSVELDEAGDEVDVTSMGAKSKETLLGIPDASINATFFQDFDTGSVHATLSKLVGDNEPFEVKVKKSSAVVGPTNPEFSMQAILPSYKPLSGGVGAASTIDATFRNAGQEGITEKTT